MNKNSLSTKAENLIKYCQENKRFCPYPNYWMDFYEILENRYKELNEETLAPELPIILTGWWEGTGLVKILTLRSQIIWADNNNIIDIADNYLRNLPEIAWFHSGDPK